MRSSAIEAVGLVKEYESTRAVDRVTFSVGVGESFGVLGPNGAGKTTAMRMLGAVLHRTGGDLRILGLDPDRDGPMIRAQIGVVPQDNKLDIELSVRDNIISYGRYFGFPHSYLRRRADELLAFVELDGRAGTRVSALSGGMKRRLVIARALISSPRILLLDEPTTGLDPQARHTVWDYLFQLRALGVTLVTTTHFMDEAEQLCDRLVLLDGGRITTEGSPCELVQRYCSREVVELRTGSSDNIRWIAGFAQQHRRRYQQVGERALVYVDDGDAFLRLVMAQAPEPINSFVRRASLEDVFLHLTGRNLVD